MIETTDEKQLLSRIRIVLVEPKEPGNIGSVARAMKNTALSRLYLINAADHRCGDARKMAVGAGDVLYGATECDSLADALKGVALAVGSTHRPRENFDVMFGPRHTAERLVGLPEGREGALVFGREENGLTNEELQLCQFAPPLALSSQAMVPVCVTWRFAATIVRSISLTGKDCATSWLLKNNGSKTRNICERSVKRKSPTT